MNFFKNVKLSEYAVPSMGIQPTEALINKLFEINDEGEAKGKPDYVLKSILKKLKEGYLENEEKQQQKYSLFNKLTKKYGHSKVNTQQLNEALLFFFFMKSVREFIYLPTSKNGTSHENLILDFLYYLSLRKAKPQMGSNPIKGVSFILGKTKEHPSITNYSGKLGNLFELYFSSIEQKYDPFLSILEALGLDEEQTEN